MVSHEPSTHRELVILPHRGVADLDVTLILQPLSSVSGQDLQPTMEGLENISSTLVPVSKQGWSQSRSNIFVD